MWTLTYTMATRGRRGAGPARGDESAGDQRAPAQQAQDQIGVPLPPPLPPVDYGALMQGLVHAMQTQAQTTAALQAQVQFQERADVWWSSVLRTQFGDGAMEVAWTKFVRLFRAKYIPIVLMILADRRHEALAPWLAEEQEERTHNLHPLKQKATTLLS
ncbi:hypothetical protein Taro_017114 [Colocasia esculenta]|uniref:Uncharacterized protein n=1 Tax=Colocasia esculenta TaxID=4460 RepID=A0A843UQK4_COLES|nr:hypothetical protein [Colocasia esculenta]